MLGSAVSTSTPRDFQPNSHIGVVARPLMNRHATPGVRGCPYAAVGMQRALDSAIGLPRRSTSASLILVFLMPAEVRRTSYCLPESGGTFETLTDPYAVKTGRPPKTHR